MALTFDCELADPKDNRCREGNVTVDAKGLMNLGNGAFTKVACCHEEDEERAVRSLAEQIGGQEEDTLLFFCSSHYNLEVVQSAIREQFPCTIVGCTTSGEISDAYSKHTLAATLLPREYFACQTLLISSLSEMGSALPDAFKLEFLNWRDAPKVFPTGNRFSILLIDGLSIMEEVFLGNISHLLQGVPLVGGSAGDDLQFNKTFVYSRGAFHQDAAVLLLVETNLKVEPFKFQHFKPSDSDMVITSADPKTRRVFEIDGAPAAEEYARILGLPIDDLTPQVFSTYPVMLQIGLNWYVRSIQKVNEDGSLTFYCAIDEGLPLTIAKGIDFVETLAEQVEALKQNFSKIELTLGFDCVLRRLEIEQKSLQAETLEVLKQIKFFGFSTYGEQFNTIHVNQTLTGVAIGHGKE